MGCVCYLWFMRNQPKPLSEIEARYQRKVADILSKVTYRDVALTYTKRDGSESRSVGRVSFFNGRIGYDTGSVTIETADKGPRTINLHRITKVE